MHLDRRTMLIALLAVTVYYGWGHVSRAAGEVVTLHAPGSGVDDHYARLWIVEDPPYYWIRAERPSRRWLESIYENPQVTLHRGAQRMRCTAEVREDADALAYVNALFRAKYGLADELRERLGGRDPVPIRLLPN